MARSHFIVQWRLFSLGLAIELVAAISQASSHEMPGANSNAEVSPQLLSNALHALPAVSIVTDPADLFSTNTGIYLHPIERGAAWERPAHLEMINPPTRSVFQVNCGLRIHGGMSRRPEESPKHSFRLVFKPPYGSDKLRFPVFETPGPTEFDTLVLRAGYNDSWLSSHGAQRQRATYLRDEWMRRSAQAMGYPSARGRFVHLYLNGLYWGIYNLCEQPGPALIATRKSTGAHDFDVLKADETKSGDRTAWNSMMTIANSGMVDPRHYLAICPYLDIPQFVDYLILNFYAGNLDWDRSANWYAIRPRLPTGPFRFFVWDAECTLGDCQVNTLDFDDDESPVRLFHTLSENAQFRAVFADRVRRLLFGQGALAPGPAAKRFQTLAKDLAPAVPAEAVRWGTYRLEKHAYKSGPYERYTLETHWQPEVNRLLTHFFPQRREFLLHHFRARGLYPPSQSPDQNKP